MLRAATEKANMLSLQTTLSLKAALVLQVSLGLELLNVIFFVFDSVL
jgi:hypothetical protein